MRQAIIFDFNRTLFDPVREELFPDALTSLQKLHEQFVLGLITTKGVNRTEEFFEKLGISQYFQYINVVVQKTPDHFQHMIRQFGLEATQVSIVGDQLAEEIRIGNQLGSPTYWLNRLSTDKQELECPFLVLSTLRELVAVLGGHDVS